MDAVARLEKRILRAAEQKELVRQDRQRHEGRGAMELVGPELVRRSQGYRKGAEVVVGAHRSLLTNELITNAYLSGTLLTLQEGGITTLVDLSGLQDGFEDADADPENEIQDLQLVDNILTITKNGTATEIDLSVYLDDTDTHLTEAEVTYVAVDLTGCQRRPVPIRGASTRTM